MEKQEIINLINSQIAEGKISKEDLSQIILSQESHPEIRKTENSKNLINIFYSIGAIIALIGIVILVLQNWAEISFGGKVFLTLGICLASYVLAFFVKGEEHSALSQVMFAFSAVLAPIGTMVLLNEANIEVTPILVGCISLLWAVVYGSALWGTSRKILILITTAFATISIYSFAAEFFDEYLVASSLFKWLTILIGVSYLIIGWSLNEYDKEKRVVQGVLYGFATIGILGTFMSFSGVFNLITLLVIFGAFYGSVFLKSRSMLIFSAIFLVAHIIKITGEYFADSINWAVALIFIGFLIIGIGYATFYLNKKYISQK